MITPDIFKLAVERAYNQIIITDPEGIIQFANSGLTRITGYTPEEVIGHTPRMWGNLMESVFYTDLWKKIKIDKLPFHGEVKNQKKNGNTYYAILTVTPIIDHKQILSGFIGVEEEITGYKQMQKRLEDAMERVKSGIIST